MDNMVLIWILASFNIYFYTEKYPPTNIEDDYDINTSVEDDTYSTDGINIIMLIVNIIINKIFIIFVAEVVQPNATSVPLDKADVNDRTGSIMDVTPMSVDQILSAHFPENVFLDESLSIDSFEGAKMVNDNLIYETLSAEEKPGALVTGIVLNNSTEVVYIHDQLH